MRIRSLVVVAVLFAAVPLLAGETKIYSGYESTRLALLNGTLAELNRTAAALASTARIEKHDAIAQRALEVSRANDVPAARSAFAALSEEMIRLRAKDAGDRPIVVYCSMEKKSWLQPKGAISNPYVAKSMRGCGEVKAQ